MHNTCIIFHGASVRLDIFLSQNYPEMSRSFIKKQIQNKAVRVNNTCEKAGYRLQDGDQVCVTFEQEKKPEILPEATPLEIVYEDSDILVVNKPKGMVVHPAKNHTSGTLVNALLHAPGPEHLSYLPGCERPGIVHRIDKDTSGLLVVAKTDQACTRLIEDFSAHRIKRVYTAMAWGTFEDASGVLKSRISRDPANRLRMAETSDGKEAITHYQVLTQYRKGAHIACELLTGRTHQIRVHMKGIGHPLIGDSVYGPGYPPLIKTGQALHAGLLGFHHPRTGVYMEFTSPEPGYFQGLIRDLS